MKTSLESPNGLALDHVTEVAGDSGSFLKVKEKNDLGKDVDTTPYTPEEQQVIDFRERLKRLGPSLLAARQTTPNQEDVGSDVIEEV